MTSSASTETFFFILYYKLKSQLVGLSAQQFYLYALYIYPIHFKIHIYYIFKYYGCWKYTYKKVIKIFIL